MSGSLATDAFWDLGGTATLENLHGWLERLDKAAPAGLKLNGIAYDKSYNDGFAINENLQDNFTVFAPWGTWAREQVKDRSFPTPTQQALIDVVSQSIKPGDTKCFIDIATLNPTPDFWTQDGSGKKSVIDTIATAINGISPDVEPVIRFLIGNPDAKARTDLNDGRWRMRDIFWTNEGPRIQHPKARLYAGFYNPNFHPKSTDDPAIKFIKLMKETLEKNPNFANMLQSFKFDDHIAELVRVGVRQLSWNHGKIFAVNGKCIYTGGTNFYTEYGTTQTRQSDGVDIDHNIVDHGVKLFGDAAVSGHKWADYFWNYLDNPADTDDNCVCWATKLSDHAPVWCTRDPDRSESTANDTIPVLIKRDVNVSGTDKTLQVNSIPTEVKRSPFEKTKTFKYGSKQIRALTVGKLGDWHGTMQQLTYPVMVIDLVRDMALNIFWQTNASLPDGVSGLGGQMYGLNKLLSDDVQKDLLFKQFSITPVAWASRHTMTKAIAYAKTSVIICQQCIVQTQSAKEDDFKAVVDKVNANESLGIKAANRWDGFVWPFDHLIAIAQALGKISTNTSTDDFKGVWIVLATKNPAQHDGWEDQTSIPRFKRRLKRIMLGLPTGVGGIPEKDIDNALSNHLHIRRVGKDNGELYSHSKIVCVDKKLMYVGSDNLYPCYNEEHGIWVEDEVRGPYHVGDWINSFFGPYYKKSTEPKDEEEEEWFQPGGPADKRFKREIN